MRQFEDFPSIAQCTICGTNENKPGLMIPIDGTEEGNNEQATLVHVDCLLGFKLRFEQSMGIFYARL